MNDTTKHTIEQIAVAVIGLAAAAIAAQYPNRQDLVYAVATIFSVLLGGRAVTHAAQINASAPPTVQMLPMAPSVIRSDPNAVAPPLGARVVPPPPPMTADTVGPPAMPIQTQQGGGNP